MCERPAFIDQTILYEPSGPERGNCTEAAVASVLGIPLSEVPDFRADGAEAHRFWSAFRRFIRSRGFEPIMLPGNHCHDVLYLASGPSPRGVNHMVVMKGGELVHDPHPSKEGIGEVETVWLLVPHDVGSSDHLWSQERRALRDAAWTLGPSCSEASADLLMAVAREIDCGSDCECGHTEHDTNAFVCPKSEEGTCGWSNAEELRRIAEAFHRASHHSPLQDRDGEVNHG